MDQTAEIKDEAVMEGVTEDPNSFITAKGATNSRSLYVCARPEITHQNMIITGNGYWATH
ncbi:MAG: hypothetical protein Udaeo2_20640 [Candidatus Udaeobacter sp.]|nr:MAG: hypothetical protein Udaeo2_20640 [Candidatus Udaeobacter sp.]